MFKKIIGEQMFKKIMISLIFGQLIITGYLICDISYILKSKTLKHSKPVVVKKEWQPVTPPVPKIEEKKFLTKDEAKATITVEDCKQILEYLASDELEGRMSGKNGNKLAASFIEKRFHVKSPAEGKVQLQKFPIARTNPGPKREVGDDFTQNIICILEGKSPDCIVVGAHMDHIGYGPSMSMDGGNKIHNGADDNASGSTVVLELEEAIAKMEKPNHTFVFICFSGEEMGLLGSQYYVRNPVIPNKIILMVNFDMVGWYKGGNCSINGAAKYPFVKDVLLSLKPNYPNLRYTVTNSAGGGSDHVPFSNSGIPAIFFFTGMTPVYHRASDDANLIDYEGLTTIAKLAFDMLIEIDKKPTNVSFSIEKTNYPMTHDHGIGVPFVEGQADHHH